MSLLCRRCREDISPILRPIYIEMTPSSTCSHVFIIPTPRTTPTMPLLAPQQCLLSFSPLCLFPFLEEASLGLAFPYRDRHVAYSHIRDDNLICDRLSVPPIFGGEGVVVFLFNDAVEQSVVVLFSVKTEASTFPCCSATAIYVEGGNWGVGV